MTSFFLYTGTEASTGFLVATLLTWRGLDAATAGLYTTVYWASLTRSGACSPACSATACRRRGR